MGILEQIAPTIATCLLGPAGGLAVTAISKALGINEKDVQGVIDSGKMSADQIVQLKLAEIEFQKQAQELGLNFEKLAVDDRKSARDMQISTHSFVPAMLSVLVITAWGIIQYFLLTHVIATEMREIIIRILGTLDAALMLVLSFYFGSSSASQAKDKMIYNSVPSNAK
jgi:uncharacterized protein Smg (DUF494 family)